MRSQPLFWMICLFLASCSAPASPPAAPGPATPTQAVPTAMGAISETMPAAQDYAIFSINVQDFSYPEHSAAVLDRIITLHEAYQIPVDFYLTDVMARIYAEQFPALLERLKNSPVVAVSYHYRAPRPYANQYDWLGLENMTAEQKYQTIMDYETHAVDPVTGQITAEPGGYAYVASLLGYAPHAASSLSSSREVDDAVIRVYKELGAQITVVHGRALNLGDVKNGLYIRPEHYDYMLFQQTGNAVDGFEAALQQAHSSQGGHAPYFVGIKMHDNDFFAERSAWLTVYVDGGKRAPWDITLAAPLLPQAEQDAMWAMYEQTVMYVASQQGRITPVNLPMILALINR